MLMKKSLAARLTPALLVCAIFSNAFALDLRRAQQTPQRDRKVNAPAPTATPQTTPAPQATPTPQTTPTPTPAPTPLLPAPRTVAELSARIAQVLSQPALAPALFGIKVVSLDTGRVLFAENAAKLLVPASNMKLYTVAAALDRLGPDFRFTTSVYARERPDAKGHVRGDLIIYGRGDPTFATRFNDGDYFKAIDDLAARIVAAGVKRIEGDIVGDESYFTGPPRSPGWEWDDLQWYYGADISALTVNDNAFDLFIKPGVRAGDAAGVTTGPANPIIRIVVSRHNEEVASAPNFLTFVNRVKTAPRGTKRDLTVHRPLGQNVVEVGGQIAEDDPGYTGSVAVAQPALLFTAMLRAALEKQGVSCKGRTRITNAPVRPQLDEEVEAGQPVKIPYSIEIASRQSPPLSEIAAQTLKPSQNLYTELILRTLGKQFPSPDPKATTAEAGITVVRKFLGEAGVETGHLALVDGSGLARQNLITAEATVQLLTYMSRHRHAQVYRDAQPLAGVDGTLRNRLKGTIAAGNMRAKTGTLNNVSGLSGYVTSAAGERLVFSMLVNHYPDDMPPRQNYLDAVAVLLASFAGKS
ncbi:MAG: D-alanyl-D-alanine carboxypeptidase/D-alanyl-D-alanine endopeptidase [Pyrinomonadaceae bacterium]